MTLPASGEITANMINVELGRAGTAYFDINGAAERGLAGVPSGQIAFSNFHGKSNIPPATHNMTAQPDGTGWLGVWYAHMGTINPTLLYGAQIAWIMENSGGFTVSIFSTQAQNFFNKLYINGRVFDTAAASYSLPSGQTRWDWNGQFAGFGNGGVYDMAFA